MQCPFCSFSITGEEVYCPNCGKQLKVKPLATGIWSQAGLYLASIFLPPLNLFWTLRYLRSLDPTAKRIGLISLAMMIIAVGLGIWYALTFASSLSQQVNQQLRGY